MSEKQSKKDLRKQKRKILFKRLLSGPGGLFSCLFVASLFVMSGLVWGLAVLVDPSVSDNNSVKEIAPHIAAIWNVLWTVGGICAFAGLLRDKPRTEVAGWILIGGSAAIYMAALIMSKGFAGTFTIFLLAESIGVALTRIYFLLDQEHEAARALKWVAQHD